MKTFKEFLTETVKLSKNQREFIALVKHQIDLDLTNHVQELSAGKRKFLTIYVDELSIPEQMNVERIARSKGYRFEPGGVKTKSIIF